MPGVDQRRPFAHQLPVDDLEQSDFRNTIAVSAGPRRFQIEEDYTRVKHGRMDQGSSDEILRSW